MFFFSFNIFFENTNNLLEIDLITKKIFLRLNNDSTTDERKKKYNLKFVIFFKYLLTLSVSKDNHVPLDR